MTAYTLDNAAPQTEARFAALDTLFDPITLAQFDAIGVGAGWRCWEVGMGSGSVAWELAGRVAPDGHVLGTDVDTRWMRPLVPSRVEVLVHDVARDRVPARGFDLVHARLVASHLPLWPAVLPRLVATLFDGGWLVVEELDPMMPYRPNPVTPLDRLVNRVGDAFTAVLASRGGEPTLGRRLARQFAAAGLVDVDAVGTVRPAAGGSAAARLMQANVAQTADGLLAHSDLTHRDLVAYREALDDPDADFFMPVFWSVRGQVPLSPPEAP